MRLTGLRLYGFRNYERADIAPAPGVTVLHGKNAQGKTNLIEAVYLCCLGRSHRTPRDGELVRWGSEAASVTAQALRADGSREVSVRLRPGNKRKKQILINGTPARRMGELMGHLNAVLFSPEDLRLVKDGPEGRRRFLDMELSQLSPAYFYDLQRYFRALRQRNELLRGLLAGRGQKLTDTLEAWDEILVESGAEVLRRRLAFIQELGGAAEEAHGLLSGGVETLGLEYAAKAWDGEELRRALKAALAGDLRRGITSVGPHRDDCRLLLDGRDARAFASQGQQRTVALSLKLAEVHVMRQTIGENPVLLLDDVMSELDASRRNVLLTRMRDIQTIITCAHLGDLGGVPCDMVCRVEAGRLEPD